MSHRRDIIAEIKAEYADADGWPATKPIPRPKALSWMQSEDLEVLGAMHRLLRYKGGRERIQPTLSWEEYVEFMTRYYRRCLCEYSQEAQYTTWEEADFGSEATHAVVWWFLDVWADKSIPRQELVKIKNWLRETLHDCPHVQELMGAALFDHLFRKRNMIKFFADWRDDPQLGRFLPTPQVASETLDAVLDRRKKRRK
jgi:hypothetical protein